MKFYAPWCGHCRRMAAAWESLAKQLAGTVNVAELDATSNPQSARRFGIRGFPTLLFFKQVRRSAEALVLPEKASPMRPRS